jgi:hypothetical protein
MDKVTTEKGAVMEKVEAASSKKRKVPGSAGLEDDDHKDKKKQKKWDVNEELAIAEYISGHYERYKVSLHTFYR